MFDRRSSSHVVTVLSTALLLLLAAPTRARSQVVPEHFSVTTIHAAPGLKATAFALLPHGRILVTEHQSGKINLILDASTSVSTVGTIPDLTISSEQGMLGLAVDPDFPDENYVYLYYTSNSGFNRVARFRVDGALSDPQSDDLTIDVEGEEILLELQNDSPLHQAGTLRFGMDKTLYISHGDDVKFKEEDEVYMQDLTNPYGKILRINRDGSIPHDNPVFSSEPAGRWPEIFAIGLRNPFRFSIDPETDRLFIGDVASDRREEFNLSTGGENFGYPRHEGSGFFLETAALIDPEPTPPIYDYPYSKPNAAVALVTYRPLYGSSAHRFPEEFDGAHFFADFFDDELQYLRSDQERGWENVSFGTGFYRQVDGALGPDGSVYLLTYGGPLRKITYSNPSVGTDEALVASQLRLEQNHPNPFERHTFIRYELPAPAPVRLEVFDLLGRRVATPVEEWQPAGLHSVRFDADGLSAGRYIYRLQAGTSPAKTRTLIHVGP